MSSDPDTLVFDRAGVLHLWRVMHDVLTDLRNDRVAVRGLMARAGELLTADLRTPEGAFRTAEHHLAELVDDLARRMGLVDEMWERVAAIDDLSAAVRHGSGGSGHAVERLTAELRREVVAFVGGDEAVAAAVMAELDEGNRLLVAVTRAHTARFEDRVDEVVAALGLDRAAATAHVHAVDRLFGVLAARAYRGTDAVAGVAVAVALDLDVSAALDLAGERGVSLVTALGWMAGAGGLGVTVPELLALEGLIDHFAAFDTARRVEMWGGGDGKVSEGDLHHVAAHPERFTGGQVLAAQALLAHPELLARLDTAAELDPVLGVERFGATRPFDGIVSSEDLRSFMVKAQVSVALAPYADIVDVAADSSEVIDGFRSRADVEAFLANTPELPDRVVAAAEAVLEQGWFDRTWLEEHRDELAMGAAVLGGGLVVVVSAGTASAVVVAATGAAAGGGAAAGTTILVNASGDAEDTDDGVVRNAFDGAIVGFSAAGFPASVRAFGASSGAERLVAAAGAVRDGAGVVSGGGLDLVIPEDLEGPIHELATAVAVTADGLVVSHRMLTDPPPWLLAAEARPAPGPLRPEWWRQDRAEESGG